MKKTSDERYRYAGAGRMRGLRDIRTLGALNKLAHSLRPLPLGDGAGLGLGGCSPARPENTTEPSEQPRTWMFVKRPKFSRHQVARDQGMLLVDRIAAEPEIDIFEEGQALTVLAELPGARPEDVVICVDADILILATTPGPDDRRLYYCEMVLPFPVNSESVQRTFRNGVLELELERAASPSPETERKQP